MFEKVEKRGAAAAQAAAERRARTIAEAVAAQAPPGVAAELVEDGVMLSGRRLRERLATDGALRILARRQA